MTRRSFKLPDVGEGVAEAEIVAWHAELGALVEEDAPLVEVMTDKATVEIPCPFSGRLVARAGEVGSTVRVGAELVAIETEAEAAAEAPPPAPAPAEVEPPPAPPSSAGVRAAPAVRARARDLGIDLAAVAGSGPDGLVEHADLDALLRGGTAPAPARREGVTEEKLVGLRRRIAERMQLATRGIPHFTYVEEIDATALEALRARLNALHADRRGRLTLLPFLVTALVRGLPDFPQVNAHYDEAEGVVRKYAAVHVGIATQTPQGLMVPVLRHAEALDPWAIAREVARLAEAARAGRAPREELSGSTISITSLGALGGIVSTPVINPPEVAIIGVNRIVERPAVHEGRVEIRRLMNLSSSFDHRVVDGWDAASFIQRVRALLETPALLFVG